MFGAIKSLLFGDKDAIAKTIWEHLGLPINAVRLKSDHKDFVHEFSEDKYLSYFFNTSLTPSNIFLAKPFNN